MDQNRLPVFGDSIEGLSQAIPGIYGELRRMAAHYFRTERRDHTLQPTALVHETLLRLAGRGAWAWQDQKHFFVVAALTMRRVLIDHARGRQSWRHGGRSLAVPLDEARYVSIDPPDYASIHDALQRLEKINPSLAQIVELHIFGGLSFDEVAAVLHKGESTVRKHWTSAKVWLGKELGDEL